jgi:pyrimidine-nucleoside phosphorylase
LVIASHLLQMGKKADSLEKGRELAEHVIKNGDAWKKFRQLIQAQEGDVKVIDQPNLLPHAKLVEPVIALDSGYLSMVNAKTVAEASILLGAGRAKKGDPIDFGVGVMAHCKVGDEIKKGKLLFTIHANDKQKLEQAKKLLYSAIKVDQSPCAPLPLFYDVIQ